MHANTLRRVKSFPESPAKFPIKRDGTIKTTTSTTPTDYPLLCETSVSSNTSDSKKTGIISVNCDAELNETNDMK